MSDQFSMMTKLYNEQLHKSKIGENKTGEDLIKFTQQFETLFLFLDSYAEVVS